MKAFNSVLQQRFGYKHIRVFAVRINILVKLAAKLQRSKSGQTDFTCVKTV